MVLGAAWVCSLSLLDNLPSCVYSTVPSMIDGLLGWPLENVLAPLMLGGVLGWERGSRGHAQGSQRGGRTPDHHGVKHLRVMAGVGGKAGYGDGQGPRISQTSCLLELFFVTRDEGDGMKSGERGD